MCFLKNISNIFQGKLCKCKKNWFNQNHPHFYATPCWWSIGEVTGKWEKVLLGICQICQMDVGLFLPFLQLWETIFNLQKRAARHLSNLSNERRPFFSAFLGSSLQLWETIFNLQMAIGLFRLKSTLCGFSHIPADANKYLPSWNFTFRVFFHYFSSSIRKRIKNHEQQFSFSSCCTFLWPFHPQHSHLHRQMKRQDASWQGQYSAFKIGK